MSASGDGHVGMLIGVMIWIKEQNENQTPVGLPPNVKI